MTVALSTRPVFGHLTKFAVFASLLVVQSRTSPIVEELHGLPSFVVPASLALLVFSFGAYLYDGRHPADLFGPAVTLATLCLSILLAVKLPGLISAGDQELVIDNIAVFAKDSIVAIAIVFAAERIGALRWALYGIVFAGTVLALLTVHKVTTGNEGWDYWGFARSAEALVSATENGVRQTGPFEDANYYAQSLVIVFALALARLGATRSRLERVGMALAVVSSVVAIGFTLSRGGLLASMAVIVMWIGRRFGRRGLAALAVVALFLLPLAPASLVDRVASVAEAPAAVLAGESVDPSIQGRTSELMVGIAMFADHPVVGVGAGNYQVNYLRYSSDIGLDPRRTGREAHSLYLESAAELGLFGLVGFMTVVGMAVTVPGRVRRRLLDRGAIDAAATASAFQLAIVGYAITAIFLHDAFSRSFIVLTALALGTVMLETNRRSGSSGHPIGLSMAAAVSEGAGSSAAAGPSFGLRNDPDTTPTVASSTELANSSEKLVVVHIVDSLRTGGAERLVAEFAVRAERNGVRCEVISLQAKEATPVAGDLAAAGIGVWYLPSSRSQELLDRARRRRLKALLAQIEPDVVHLHLESSIVIGGAVARGLGIPTVATVHNTTPFLGRLAGAKFKLLVRALRRIDRILVVGSSVAETWQERLGGEPLEVLANPVRDLPTETERPGRSLLVAVGRLSVEKGTTDLVNAMALVAMARPSARLRIVGDGPERADVEQTIDRLKLNGSIKLLGIREDVGEILAASDVFVSASHSEGMPLAVLEAMATGLPIVATDVGSVPDIVPEQAGVLVEPRNHAALAAAVIAYLDDPVTAAAAGAAGRDYVMLNHHPDDWAAHQVALYRDLHSSNAQATSGRASATRASVRRASARRWSSGKGGRS